VAREKWLDPSNWASLKPFGIGEEHPNNYLELWKAFKENRDQARYAWRILTQGTCDGCALGTKGMRDWTTRQVHLCNVRLRLLRLNTMPALDTALLADVALLAGKRSAELRGLGRFPYPMVRRREEPGFTRIGWDEALDLVAGRVRASTPGRLGVYLTSRGTPNETYFAAQKAVRAMGTNSVDNAARVCHSPSTFGLKGSLGVAATTCSYSDWIGSDLIVFIGANVANNQPVATGWRGCPPPRAAPRGGSRPAWTVDQSACSAASRRGRSSRWTRARSSGFGGAGRARPPGWPDPPRGPGTG
jgi:hypothetical protein